MAIVSLDITVTAGEAARIQAAYQQAANVSVNGTASSAQVLAYIKTTVRQQIVDTVKSFEKTAAVTAVPDPAPISPT